jgi:hypothetical protein
LLINRLGAEVGLSGNNLRGNKGSAVVKVDFKSMPEWSLKKTKYSRSHWLDGPEVTAWQIQDFYVVYGRAKEVPANVAGDFWSRDIACG